LSPAYPRKLRTERGKELNTIDAVEKRKKSRPSFTKGPPLGERKKKKRREGKKGLEGNLEGKLTSGKDRRLTIIALNNHPGEKRKENIHARLKKGRTREKKVVLPVYQKPTQSKKEEILRTREKGMPFKGQKKGSRGGPGNDRAEEKKKSPSRSFVKGKFFLARKPKTTFRGRGGNPFLQGSKENL